LVPGTAGAGAMSNVARDKLVFDPVLGGWTEDNRARPQQQRAFPPHYSIDDTTDESLPRARDKHYESVHHGPFQLSMAYEEELGLAPAKWSVSSKMDDPRPNGKAIFDARHIESPVGRARAGRSMVWDPKGTANAGETKKAENWDAGAMAEAAEQDFGGMAHEYSPEDGMQ
jgi:hypothetical protein